MRKRAIFVGGAGALALALLGLVYITRGVWRAPGADEPPLATSVAVSPPWEGRASGQVKDFTLTAGRTQWELAPGKVVDAFAYNGRVPGPEIRVAEGDSVRITVINELAEPTTIHWHGVELPVGMDGVPRLSQAPILPGGTFVYEFVATPAGTRWYHSHFNEMTQQGGGLTGALIIEPRGAPGRTHDREYVVLTGTWAAHAGNTHQPAAPAQPAPAGMGGMMGNDRSRIDAFTVNGRMYPHVPPLVVREGERVRLRLLNAAGTESQAFALAGHRLTITHSDGNPLAGPLEAEAIYLGVGERTDVEFVADNPGRWQLRGLNGHADQGLAVDVVYEGHEGDAVTTFPPGTRFRPALYADFTGPPRPSGPRQTYDLTLSGGMMGMTTWTINGRSYPNTEHVNVRPGQRVRLKLFNMSMEDHPMHLHGHTFQVVGVGGKRIDGPLKDTLTVRHMEQYEIEFVADNPGVWLFHCHNLDHMEGGLMAEVHYR